MPPLADPRSARTAPPDAALVAGDDYAGDASTRGRITVGGSVTGTLERGGDTDWFALTLARGDSVRVQLEGRTLADPYLSVLTAAGAVLSENDDADGLDSELVFTAAAAGTYYLEAAGFSPDQTGSYSLSVQAVSATGGDPLRALDWGMRVTEQAIGVYFAPRGLTDMREGITSEGANAYEQSRFLAAFDQISAVADLRFTPVRSPDAAAFTLILDTDELPPNLLGFFNPPGERNAGVGVFNATAWDRGPGGDLETGGYGFVTILHELLHGLGLAHPHDTGGRSTVMAGVTGPFALGLNNLNQGVYTAMSYNTGHVLGPSPDSGGDWGFETGPMALDIAVLQAKYGPNPTTGAGDDTYLLPDANIRGTGYAAIWDVGGFDTLAHAGPRPATLDLRAATLDGGPGSGGQISQAQGIAGGYTIAAGVTIEAARGGRGADTLIGNAADNRLTGGRGHDTLEGGAGTDTAVIAAREAETEIRFDGDTLVLRSADGTDRLTGIERIAFRDVTRAVTEIVGTDDIPFEDPAPEAPAEAARVVGLLPLIDDFRSTLSELRGRDSFEDLDTGPVPAFIAESLDFG